MEIKLSYDFLNLLISLFTLIATASIPIIIYRYSIKRDKMTFLLKQWDHHQKMNEIHLQDTTTSEEFENIVYRGLNHSFDASRARKLNLIFIYLNYCYMNWHAYKNSILKKEEFEESIEETVGLIIRSKELMEWALRERGYPEDFRCDLVELIGKVHKPPLEPPNTF